ncbi:hypothetical protein CPB83DRAFT_894026 [Crepidotus variabilis]|uniref:Uncharacterized protein n=1 Tax=Crepidotus variabilis TaxID=179855 RepID=A0A9P6EGQ2_9AGAR|nr:hypothetical protein CPB83DRAFT_894026 [Crepidotus variabilis]
MKSMIFFATLCSVLAFVFANTPETGASTSSVTSVISAGGTNGIQTTSVAVGAGAPAVSSVSGAADNVTDVSHNTGIGPVASIVNSSTNPAKPSSASRKSSDTSTSTNPPKPTKSNTASVNSAAGGVAALLVGGLTIAMI